MKKMNFAERLKNTGANDPCPCGSGKKYKKCHLSEDEEAQRKIMKKQQEEKLAELAQAKKDDPDESKDNRDDKKIKHDASKPPPKLKMSKQEKQFNIPRRSAV